VPKMLRSIWEHDGVFRLRLATLLTDTWLWRWGLRFLATCGDKAAISTTELFLRDHSPYFNRLTRTIATAEGFTSRVDDVDEAMVLFADCGADGSTPRAVAGAPASAATQALFSASAEKAAQPPPVPWAASTALSHAEAAAREPSLANIGAVAGALHVPHDKMVDSHAFTTALAHVCETKYGVRFVHGVSGDVAALVDGDGDAVDVSSRHNVRGVVALDGRMYHSDIVIVASGAQAPRLLAPLDVDVPIYPVKGYSLTYDLGADCDVADAPTGMVRCSQKPPARPLAAPLLSIAHVLHHAYAVCSVPELHATCHARSSLSSRLKCT
jgi:glycine/D-amino acid oxidase-like deaminating enzyme